MADYHALWESLGMDLGTHDQLCAALPPLFEETFLNQTDRPEGMDYFNMVIAEVHGLRIQELADHKARGGLVVGSFCVYVPEEIVSALGGVLVGLCAGSQFWVPAGEKVLPRSLCPLIKAGLGAKLSRTCPYFQSVDLVVGENTCDGKKKAWEILGQHVPMHVMDLPNRKSPAGFALWREEIRRLTEELERTEQTEKAGGIVYLSGLLGMVPTEGNEALEFLGHPVISLRIGVGSALILGVIGLLAGYFPARRAAGINPAETLRYE